LFIAIFYFVGVPFNLARNPNYIAASKFLANTDLGGYVPPGYNKLRTTLLQHEKINVERLLQPSRVHGLQKG